MQYCNLCHVKIAGNKRACPLCKGPLVGEPEPETEVFPPVLAPRRLARLAIQILTPFIFIIVMLVRVLQVYLPPRTVWPVFVALAVGCLWLSILLGISRRRVLLQNLTFQTLLFSGISILWDYETGWRNWSIDFVLPILTLTSLMAVIVLKWILRVNMGEAIPWMGTLSVFGCLPIFFYWIGWVKIGLPSFLCSGISGVVFIFLLIFFHRYMREEAARRFHL